jgi:hypothetical protein
MKKCSKSSTLPKKGSRLRLTGVFTIFFIVLTGVFLVSFALGGLADIDSFFRPTGLVGDTKNITVRSDNKCNCIIITYRPSSDPLLNYGGVYWQYPYNWGEGNGRDLTGFKGLTFEAISNNKPNSKAFFSVGYPADQYYTEINEPVPGEWKQFRIDLSGKELSNVKAGFGCIVRKSDNPQGAEIKIRNIYYEI